MLRDPPTHCLRRVFQLLEPHVRRGTLLFQQRIGVQVQPRPLTARGVRRLRSVATKIQNANQQLFPLLVQANQMMLY